MSTPESSNTPSPSEAAGSADNTGWEARYQQGDTPWEKGAPAPPLVDWLTRNAISGRVLVPGCGSGHDVRALAAAGADPVGIDIAPSAIARAQNHPPTSRESYQVADLFSLPPELRGVFDWVFEHTCFCAIDPSLRTAYVQAVRMALKPGERMLAVFYLDPGHDHPDEGPPFGVQPDRLLELFSPYFDVLESYVPPVAYPGREGRELVQTLQRRANDT